MIYTVSQLNQLIKTVLEKSLSEIELIGEISNFKAHYSGHWYFSLKDADSQIACAMWKGLNSFVAFTPQEGMKVVITGRITVYPPRGTYQVDVRTMKPAGIGELQLAYEKLKLRLSAEGLFDIDKKKPIPPMPFKVGVVTSIDGAALRDIISVASRRFPICELIISPCKVQGNGAAVSIVNAIENLEKYRDVDVIIIARGGGSIEDLWPFNEEIVARAIYKCEIPIISGVGHEVDITIADFVADKRAATPTAAMEIAVPHINDIKAMIQNYTQFFLKSLTAKIDNYKNFITNTMRSSAFMDPSLRLSYLNQEVMHVLFRLDNSIRNLINNRLNKVEKLAIQISSNNVQNTLKKGFVLVKQQGKFVKYSRAFSKETEFSLLFSDGEVPISN